MFKILTLLSVLTAILFGFAVITSSAQTLGSSSVSASPLENQAQVVKTKQASEAEIQTTVINFKAENETLNTDILSLKNRETELQSQIINLNKNLKDFKAQSIDKIPTLSDKINQTKQDLDQAQKDLLTVKNDLAAKQVKLQANLKTLDEAQTNLAAKTKEVKQEVNTLQQQLFVFGAQFSVYFSLILSYWLVWQILRIINKRFVKNKVVGTIISFSSTLLALIATLLTLLIAFIGNLALLITSFGVFSAALVLALQDFVSSFFAWILIGFSRIYRVGDTISITTGKGVVTGTVTLIGLFRTVFKEKVGGFEMDKEMVTGKILSFPNNLVLKESVSNYTKDNNVIWHSFSLIITFESDHRKARKILENICKEQFQYAVDHEQQYFAGTYNIKQYKPRVYMNIAGDGPSFTIWFATKIGFFRERLEKYNESILDAFQKEGIELAYNTTRLLIPDSYAKKSSEPLDF